jgi:hypothetical protein
MSLTTLIFIALVAFTLFHHLRPGGHGGCGSHGSHGQAPKNGGGDGPA